MSIADSITVLADGRPPVRHLFDGVPAAPAGSRLQPALFGPEWPAGTEPLAGPDSTAERRFAAGLLTAVLEALSGRRAAGQLGRWITEDALAELTGRAGSTSGALRPRSLHVQPLPGADERPRAAEVCARLSDGERDLAVALRIEQVRGRWLCTCLDFGPPSAPPGSGPPRLSPGARDRP